jgi:hypothetical protein
MVLPSIRITPILCVALFASAMLSACSDDSAVSTGPDDPFKGRSCFDFTDYLHTASLTETPGWALAVAIEDDVVYVADGNNGLQIIDCRNEAAPVLRGAIGTSDPAQDVDAADGIACVTLGTGGVAVIDAGDLDRPVIVGRVTTPGGARGVTVVDTVVYVADDVVGLVLISIARPDAPYTLGVDNSPGRAVDVDVAAAFAYVADEQNGCRVVNVRNPSDPWLVNTVSLPFGGRGVDVSGNLAFVAAGGGGLQIIDISTPGGEKVVGSVAARGVAENVAVDATGRVAFVAKGRNGVDVVDVADPNAPEIVNLLATSEDAIGIAAGGGIAVVGESAAGVRTVNSLAPQPPPVTARLPGSVAGEVNCVASGPGKAYGAGSTIGLFVVEPGRPDLQPLGTLALSYDAVALMAPGDTVYVAPESGGIEMVDVSDPTRPASAGWVPYQGGVASLDWRSGVLYFAGGRTFGTWIPGDGGVNTVDLVSSTASAVAVDGDYAFVGKTTNSMQAVNIEVPDRPISIFPLGTAGSSRDMVAADGYLFIVTAASSLPNSSNGLEVYDVRNPLTAGPVAFVNFSTRPYRAALAKNLLYVAAGNGGTVVIDVSDPANPLRIGSAPSQSVSMGAAVAGGTVFVADGVNGVFTVPAQGCVPSP